MKDFMIFLILFFFISLLIRCLGHHPTDLDSSGTTRDTMSGNKSNARVYNPDLTPAAGAIVRFYSINDTTRIPSSQRETDATGCYTFHNLAKGMYNIIANNDSLFSYQDSVYINLDTAILYPDTLEKPGSITAIVGLQPNHNPNIITAQALGTNVFCNVDSLGRFTLWPLSKGTYNVYLLTTLQDYTPRYISINLTCAINDTLKDTIWLAYTGIPIVQGMNATYDTINGLVRLTWNKTSYWDFQKYTIYRDDFLSIKPSICPIGTSSDTLFIDTIYRQQLPSGLFSFSDTNDYHYKYRVAIRSNAEELSKTYKNIDIIAASPLKVKTNIQLSICNIAKDIITDTASINNSILYKVFASNPICRLKKVVWLDSLENVIKAMQADTLKKTIEDSLIYTWKDLGRKILICKIIDDAERESKDTVRITYNSEEPTVNLTSPRLTYAFGDTIRLHANILDKFGSIVKIEWSIGNNDAFLMNMASDTFVIAPTAAIPNYNVIIRLTKDDGNKIMDTVRLSINTFRLVTDSALFFFETSVIFDNKIWLLSGPYSGNLYSSDGITWIQAQNEITGLPLSGHTSLVYDNKIWIIGGTYHWDGAHNSDKNGWRVSDAIYYSSNGIEWKKAMESVESAAFHPSLAHSSLVYDNKMWFIGGNGKKNTIWYSSDGIDWKKATDSPAFPSSSGYTSLAYNNKMWVINGSFIRQYHDQRLLSLNDIWYSSDGIDWKKATDSAAFSPRSAVISSIVYDNKMWIIGGGRLTGRSNDYESLFNDIWCSSDGITWTQTSSSAGFPPRIGHMSVVFDNKLWIIGGVGIESPYSSIWCSGPGGLGK